MVEGKSDKFCHWKSTLFVGKIIVVDVCLFYYNVINVIYNVIYLV